MKRLYNIIMGAINFKWNIMVYRRGKFASLKKFSFIRPSYWLKN